MIRILAAAGVAALSGLIAFAPMQSWREEWRMKPAGDNGKVHFTIERVKPGSRWVHGSDVAIERFRGLPVGAPNTTGTAKFEFVGDAGRLICQGHFTGRGGVGTYEFVRNGQFGAELQRLGYDAPAEDALFSMLMSDVTLAFAREVKEAGVPSTTKELLEMRIHGIDTEYIREMRSTGYTNLAARDYIEMRIHGVSPELVRELKQAGYDIPAKKVVELKIHGVSPQYIRELKSYGLRPDASEVVEMKIHGVSPEYLKGMNDAGYGSLAIREVVDMRIHGVGSDFAVGARTLGYSFTAKELTQLRVHGVNEDYLKRLKSSGYQNLTADKIVKLKIHGID